MVVGVFNRQGCLIMDSGDIVVGKCYFGDIAKQC